MENLDDTIESAEDGKPSTKPPHGFIRPHTAKPKKTSELDRSTSPDPQPTRTIRPWSAHPKTRSNVSKKKIVRQNLRKSHMRPPSRSSKTGSETPRSTSTDGQVLSIVGFENVDLAYTPRTYQIPGEEGRQEADGILEHGVRTLISGNA